jgi:hypothetical protein
MLRFPAKKYFKINEIYIFTKSGCRVHGSFSGCGLPKAGAYPSRKTRSQFHDGYSTHKKGKQEGLCYGTPSKRTSCDPNLNYHCKSPFAKGILLQYRIFLLITQIAYS